MIKVTIQYQDHQGYWRSFRTSHHEPSAYKEAHRRAKTTGKRHRLVDGSNRILDIIDA